MPVAFRSKTFTKVTSAASVTNTPPSGLANDDILVFLLYKENAAAVTWPAGFTEGGSILSADSTMKLYYAWKRAASESGNYTPSWTGSTYALGTLLAISGAITSGDPNDVTPTTYAGAASPATIACPSITPATDNALVIAFGANYSRSLATATVTSGYTIHDQTDISAVASALKSPAGATGTIAYTISSLGHTVAMTLAIKPPSEGQPMYLRGQDVPGLRQIRPGRIGF